MSEKFLCKITPTKLQELTKKFGYDVSQKQAKSLVNRFYSQKRSLKENRKDLIKDEAKTLKSLLKDEGLEIKQRHLLEIISRGCFNQDWNSAGKLTVEYCSQNVLTKNGYLSKKHYEVLIKEDFFRKNNKMFILDNHWVGPATKDMNLEFHDIEDFELFYDFMKFHISKVKGRMINKLDGKLNYGYYVDTPGIVLNKLPGSARSQYRTIEKKVSINYSVNNEVAKGKAKIKTVVELSSETVTQEEKDFLIEKGKVLSSGWSDSSEKDDFIKKDALGKLRNKDFHESNQQLIGRMSRNYSEDEIYSVVDEFHNSEDFDRSRVVFNVNRDECSKAMNEGLDVGNMDPPYNYKEYLVSIPKL